MKRIIGLVVLMAALSSVALAVTGDQKARGSPAGLVPCRLGFVPDAVRQVAAPSRPRDR
jgi:hypothetical protein